MDVIDHLRGEDAAVPQPVVGKGCVFVGHGHLLVQRCERTLMVWRVAGRDWACPPALLVLDVLGWPGDAVRRVSRTTGSQPEQARQDGQRAASSRPAERKGISRTMH